MLKTMMLTVLIALYLTVAPAWACPYCESDIGNEVAAGIFNDDFAINALLTLLPIPILLLIVCVLHFGFPFPKRSSKRSATEQPNPPMISGEPLGAEYDG